MIELPQNRKEWELWPLRSGFRAHEENSVDQTVPPFVKVGIDGAITGSQGLSESEEEHISQQSFALQQIAATAMAEGDAESELESLQKATELFTSSRGSIWLSPFYSQLYSVRCSYLSALLANGKIAEAVEQCEHIVSFLAVVFSHVRNHPLLGLQLYTLGDLYNAAASMEGDRLALEEKAKLAYTWAKQIMIVTHGANDSMVKRLEENLASAAGP
jgi:hypothetical protein